jgi:hypothetical protein
VIRFHLDEHVDHAIARGLRNRGIDVTTATDANLLGASDEAHFEIASREKPRDFHERFGLFAARPKRGIAFGHRLLPAWNESYRTYRSLSVPDE